jgi:hypothetical protein
MDETSPECASISGGFLRFSAATEEEGPGPVGEDSQILRRGLRSESTPHREAYDGSVKWLTNKRFASNKALADPDHERFRAALHKYFGASRIKKLQETVAVLTRSCSKELGGKKPTAPDLWLVDKGGKHRFIEVKLPGDAVAPHQLAGMAAIASVLGPADRVSVEVIQLHDDERMFRAFCRAIHAG